jgi:hypothetical protein
MSQICCLQLATIFSCIIGGNSKLSSEKSKLMLVTLKDIGVTLVLDFGDVTFSQHIITYVAEDLELLNLA